jgi:signal transduction histidine kinase
MPISGRDKPGGFFTFTMTPIRCEGGRVGGLLSIATETTAVVLAQRAAANEVAKFASLFEQAPSFMAVLRGPDHIIELANPGYLALVGHRPVLGKAVAEVLPEAAEQGYVAILDQVYLGGQPYTANGAKYSMQVTPGGPVLDRFVDFVYQPIRDASGDVAGIFVQGVDVSEVRKAEQSLREADIRKNHFVSMLAHELRNPLAPIANALMVLDRDPPAAAAARMRTVIHRQLRHIVRLVDDLMDVSRATLGKVVVTREPVAVDAVCSEAVDAAKHMCKKGQTIVLAVGGELPPVFADRVRLTQVLVNLLNNACKYGRQGGTAVLRASPDGNFVRFEIEDDGEGIDPAFLPRVFDLFEQWDASLDRSAGGIGIGLTLVKSLVELHEGRVKAESEGPGKGSRFTVWMPLAR